MNINRESFRYPQGGMDYMHSQVIENILKEDNEAGHALLFLRDATSNLKKIFKNNVTILRDFRQGKVKSKDKEKAKLVFREITKVLDDIGKAHANVMHIKAEAEQEMDFLRQMP